MILAECTYFRNPLAGRSLVHIFANTPGAPPAGLQSVGRVYSPTPRSRYQLIYNSKNTIRKRSKNSAGSNQKLAIRPANHRQVRRPKGAASLKSPVRPMALKLHGHDSCDMLHVFAITSPPGGVHIFACHGSFGNLRPNLAYFRLLPPYAPVPGRPSKEGGGGDKVPYRFSSVSLQYRILTSTKPRSCRLGVGPLGST